jgi:hypothetical protein
MNTPRRPLEKKGLTFMRTRELKTSKSGQTSVEYILILALLVGVITLFGGQFKEKITGIVGDLFGNVSGGINSLSSGG